MQAIHRWATIAGVVAVLTPLAVIATAAGPADAETTPTAPTDFMARSTTWLDAEHGFLLGTASCGEKTCTEVVATADAGSSWSRRGQLHVPIRTDNGKRPGVGELRLGDRTHGWAYGPLLQHTADGGRTWTANTIPDGGGQVLALDSDTEGSWAVVSPCAWPEQSGACTKRPLSLWRTTTATGTTWKQVQSELPFAFQADVSAFGTTVYVTDPQLEFGRPDILLLSTDGRTFDSRKAPCDHKQEIALTQVVATSTSSAALLCNGDPGIGKAVKRVYTTSDLAASYRSRGTTGPYGIEAQLAAAPSGKLAVASWSIASFIYDNDGGTTWDMPVGLEDGGLGWNDIVYVTDRDAYVVYAPAGTYAAQGQLWATHDGGQTWAPQPL